ncbi:uncharacterized protein LOC123526138 isoform X1 [Mercenaria mercenaria]|uniref:uncharacterized protein LOC123526138 isoform X1 n=1 Tax=Mercenaria mercenaria TaxID=6596 RepID=UPI00234EBF58|nr:uncharacterized protein LOC123526138 isoform X1 [Mercenaria mercenaria]XP_053378792.1 uncharacterized protein LOC123526138 isoform X1 [Mercenaria mercenaria]XP_053378793.1 uncharacterized protein LOC123526138 isoform X1 [Mercenaria mercenaria]XP_053378795.1 uncharacterized protein LOC123526138 isoform X1 [Mercenaria mercenaria]
MCPAQGIEGKRSRLTRRICILAGVTLLMSLVAIIVGIVSVAVSGSASDFPFSAGAAMVAGIPAFLLSFCPMYMYYEGAKTSGQSTTGCFDCCTILMVVWFSITILAICFGFGLGGIYGVVACTNQAERIKVCLDSADSKMALSVVTIVITLVLFVLSLAIFFTCCCNAATFGMPLMVETADSYSYGNYYNRPDISLYNRRENRQESAIQNALPDARRQQPRPRSPVENISYNNEIGNRTMTEPSAPHLSGTRQESFEDIDTGSFEPYSSGRSASSYSDPPPSYDEVMRKEQSSETAV